MGRPMNFMFDSRIGYSGTADRMTYFRLHQIQYGGLQPSWIFKMMISSEMGRPIDFMFDSRAGF